MSDLILKQQTMSSYDFLHNVINPARLEAGENEVENRHFIARVEDELDDLEGCKTFTRFGNQVKFYDLTIDQMMLVGMRESKAVRKNVLAKLKDMEKAQLPNFNDPVESARAWADAKESELKALALIEEQKPKVQYYDAVAKNEHHMNATQLAQKFNLGVVTFNKHLLDLGIYNKNIVKPKTFKQDFVNKGFGRMTTTTNGFSQAVFTTKGEQYLHELLVGEGII